MNSIRQVVKRVTPVSWRRAFRRYVNREEMAWQFSYKHWLSVLRMQSFHNKHEGQRCFIIGNGPSLNKTDLSLLRNEVTFGLNRIYLLFPKMGFPTTYFVSVNRLVIEQSIQEIVKLPMPKFITWHARDLVLFTPETMFIRDPVDSLLGFSKDPARRIWEGSTVTYVAMQLAYYMGFKQVILIGVDHFFVTQGEPNKEVVSPGDDPNHFAPDYFGKGFRWQLADLENAEKAYRLAQECFEQDGREILDATVGGKLQVFPKVDYRTLF